MFLCPSCEEIADQQTICCETCDSWFHYNCVGITVNDVEKISSEVPFICDNCTENLIYDSNQTLMENRNLPTSQDHGQGLSELHNSNNQTDSLFCTQAKSQQSESEPPQEKFVSTLGSSQEINTMSMNSSSVIDVSLVTPTVKTTKKKAENKANMNVNKSKRNQNCEDQQSNIDQLQYIQRLELKYCLRALKIMARVIHIVELTWTRHTLNRDPNVVIPGRVLTPCRIFTVSQWI